ncbi:MAG: hypothetical protein IJ638_02355 [Alphaproteobacteria bacterium]|nr:hypothetical protein [Alphaproteobacteria bacterium]
MKRIETKNLPNNVKLSAYFENTKGKSIEKIEALKEVYVKNFKDRKIEKRDLILRMEKVNEKNTTFMEQIYFNGNKTGFAEVHYAYSYEPTKLNPITDEYEDYKWKRNKTNPTLLQVWKSPLDYSGIKEFIKLFYGFDEKNPINFASYDTLLKQYNQDKESLNVFLRIAREDKNLGPFQEYSGYQEDYFDMFIKGNCR